MSLLAKSMHNLPRNVSQILVCGSPRKWNNNFPTPSPASTHTAVQQEKKALVWLRRPILLSLSRGWVNFGMRPRFSPRLSSIPRSSSYKSGRLWSNRSQGVQANLGILHRPAIFLHSWNEVITLESESSHVWEWRFKNEAEEGGGNPLLLDPHCMPTPVLHTFSFIPHHNPQGIIIFLIPRRWSLTKKHEIQVTEFQPHFVYLQKICSFPNTSAVVESEASGIWPGLTMLTLSFLT